MKPSKTLFPSLFLLALLSPELVMAHSNEDGSGFVSGLTHPIYGFDHFLAMLSVGIISSQLGGRNIWLIPLLFVIAMIGGGVLGMYRIDIPLVETGIALSVIILGIAIIVANKNTSVLLIMSCVLFFGTFHGYAHGYEMPDSASPVYYAFGFIVSTACIHLLGVLVGHIFMTQQRLTPLLKYSGSAMTAAGFYILYGVLV